MISEVDGKRKQDRKRGPGRFTVELNEEPDSVIRSKPARSLLPADCGGPGPQGARQFVRPRDVPGPRGGCCAPCRGIFHGFRGAAEPAVATGPLIFSGEQTSGHQPLLEADLSVSTAERGSVQIHAPIWVPGPDSAHGLCVQALSLTAGGASLPLPLSSVNRPPQDSFGRQSPRLSVAWSTVHLSRPLRGSLPPADALLLGGPATCSPSNGAVVCRLWSFVCHAHCGL